MVEAEEHIQTPLSVFYSYDPKDEGLREELDIHLRLLQRQGIISGWHQCNILAGSDKQQESSAFLNKAQIILLLISSDFLASDYCYSTEMRRALERHETGEARVIPIILRPVSWERAPFNKLQVLPREGIPITSSKQWESRDEAWTHVVKELESVLAYFTATRHSSSLPTPISRIWQVPYRRNPLFTGREGLLAQLHDRFTRVPTNTTIAFSQSQAISGLGGIGKTQVALEYAYRYRQKYRTVLWVSAATEETLQTELASLARVLGLPEQHTQEQEKVIAAVQKWFTQHQDWLLILDNADDLPMACSHIPAAAFPNGHLLLTTRAQAAGTLAQLVEIEQMDQEEGALLLLRRAHILSPESSLKQASAKAQQEAEAIIKELGGLPLAIDQAGAYLEETGCNLAGYLDLYQLRHKELLKRRSRIPSEHPEPVATTWSLSFRLVEQANPAAAELLRFCAWLGPDAIPKAMLMWNTKHLGPVLSKIVVDPFAFNQAIEELRKFSLIRRYAEGEMLSVHRLVQAVLKDTMTTKVQRQWAKRALLIVHAAFPRVEYATWEHCRIYLPHALVCAEYISRYQIVSPEAAHLLDSVGWYLREQTAYTQAESLLKQALAIEEDLGAVGQEMLAGTLNNLARLYRSQGRYTQAEPLFLRALALKESILGSDHPDTAITLNNLGLLYRFQGRYTEAEPLFLRSLTIKERTLGFDHPDTAATLDHLAQLYLAQRKYTQAEPLFLRALAIDEQKLGSDHPYTAIALNDLALLYRFQGRYAQSESLFLKALNMKEHSLGFDHPDTAVTLNDLAQLYLAQSKYTQTETLLQRALTINEQSLGSAHPDTAVTLHNLAQLYQNRGQYEQAESLYRRALSIKEQALGPDHPTTGITLRNLAQFYQGQKQYEQAEPLYQRVLLIDEHVYGPEHPEVATDLEGYIALLQVMGRDEEVTVLMERAQIIRAKLRSLNAASGI